MLPWRHLATAAVPDGGGELRLMQRGAEFSIMASGIELMNSRLFGSEQALATLVTARLEDRPAPRLLIGGFGMGFTLRAALENLPAKASVTVGELVPAILDWARGPMAELSAACLSDPRVRIAVGDVTLLIRSSADAYDAILLDVDNGPEGLSRRANNRLYDLPGLHAARRALTPGGVLAVWSSAPNAAFAQRLAKAGFAVEELPVRASGKGRGARHIIWIAIAP